MVDSKQLNGLRDLEEKILAEVVREGEMMVLAQFQAATAADQRCMAWAGFVITVGTAAVGASFTLGIGGKHFPLAVISGLLSVLLSVSAMRAIQSVVPSTFYLPGNLPENWLPSRWEESRPHNLHQARIEQARCLQLQIEDNKKWAQKSGELLRESMWLAVTAALLAGVYAAGYAVWKIVT